MAPEEIRKVHAAGFWRYSLLRLGPRWIFVLLTFCLGKYSNSQNQPSVHQLVIFIATFAMLMQFLSWLFWLDLRYKFRQLDEEPPG